MSYIPDVPFVPTPEPVVKRMLEIAGVKPNDVVYDLGAGDGRIIITAATLFNAHAVGIEIRKEFVSNIESKIKSLGLDNKVVIMHGNIFDADISKASVVTMYLLTSVNERIRPKLEKELRPGVRVVSHDFEVPGWVPNYSEEFKEENGRVHRLYLYIMPPKKSEIPRPKFF